MLLVETLNKTLAKNILQKSDCCFAYPVELGIQGQPQMVTNGVGMPQNTRHLVTRRVQ